MELNCFLFLFHILAWAAVCIMIELSLLSEGRNAFQALRAGEHSSERPKTANLEKFW